MELKGLGGLTFKGPMSLAVEQTLGRGILKDLDYKAAGNLFKDKR